MPITTVNYILTLTKPGITITKIEFNNKRKEGNDLLNDYKAEKNCFEGTITGVLCDCQTVDITVYGNGPAGGKTKMTAKLCETKTLRDEPLVKKEVNGIYDYTTTVLLR